VKTVDHRITVYGVGAADTRKSAGEEFVTEPAAPRGRKRKLEAGQRALQSWSIDNRTHRSGLPAS